MTEHPQAELLRAIADGRQMQIKDPVDKDWADAVGPRALGWLAQGCEVRIKPATILVNGIEVPEPIREALENGVQYWVAVTAGEYFAVIVTWGGDIADKRWLERGLCHTTEAAAMAHAKAMLAPSMKGGV